MQIPENAQASKEASVDIAATCDVVYALVSDLTRMGEWSPEATGGEWLDGGSGQVGDWFLGHNQVGEREWSRQVQVAVADPGREFAFVVGGVDENCTWWCYEMEPVDGGTRLTEKWWFVNKTPGLAAASEEQLQARIDATQGALEATIAAVKATAEGG